MEIKTISCERVVNLGNYESRRLQVGAELSPGEDVEAAINSLAELIERKAQERFDLEIDAKELRREVRRLKEELAQLQAEKEKLVGSPEPDLDFDNIPFKSGDAAIGSSIPDGF